MWKVWSSIEREALFEVIKCITLSHVYIHEKSSTHYVYAVGGSRGGVSEVSLKAPFLLEHYAVHT